MSEEGKRVLKLRFRRMWLSLLRSFAPVRLSQRAFLLALFERGITNAGLIERWTGYRGQTYMLSSTGGGRRLRGRVRSLRLRRLSGAMRSLTEKITYEGFIKLREVQAVLGYESFL